MEHILEYSVHNRDKLSELIGIMVGFPRLLRGSPTLDIRDAQLNAQSVLLGFFAQFVAAGIRLRARDQYLVRIDGPVDRYRESDLALKFSVSL